MPLCKLQCTNAFIFAILVHLSAITALQPHHLDQMQTDKEAQLYPHKRIRKHREQCHKVIISDSSYKTLLFPQLIHQTKRDQFGHALLAINSKHM